MTIIRSAGLSLIGLSMLHSAAVGQAPRERRFAMNYTVTVDHIPTLANRVDIWLPVPHDDAYQSISRFDVTSDFSYREGFMTTSGKSKVQTGAYGNRMFHMRLDAPALKPSIAFEVQFVVKRREHLSVASNGKTTVEDKAGKDPNLERWLEPDRLVPLDDKIRGWAQEVVDAAGAKTDLEKARAIYNHIVATVKYDKTGQGWGRGDIYYAYDARRGDCTDFHAIFIGYARALGIPARFSIGLPIPKERGQGAIAGYHCWAEFYINGMGWIPVDASESAKDPSKREYFFGAHDENRVEFSRGRDVNLTPKQQGEPLNYFVYPYVEVDGKPYAGVKYTFRYADIASKH